MYCEQLFKHVLTLCNNNVMWFFSNEEEERKQRDEHNRKVGERFNIKVNENHSKWVKYLRSHQFLFYPDGQFLQGSNNFNILVSRIRQVNGNGLLVIQHYENIEQLNRVFNIRSVRLIIIPGTPFTELCKIIKILSTKPCIRMLNVTINYQDFDNYHSLHYHEVINWDSLIDALDRNVSMTDFSLDMDVCKGRDDKHINKLCERTMIQNVKFKNFELNFNQNPIYFDYSIDNRVGASTDE